MKYQIEETDFNDENKFNIELSLVQVKALFNLIGDVNEDSNVLTHLLDARRKLENEIHIVEQCRLMCVVNPSKS